MTSSSMKPPEIKSPLIKKPLLFSDIDKSKVLDKVIIESLEQALYRLVIELDQQQYYILEKPGKSLTRRSLLEIQELLIPFQVAKMFLSHQSPYDEMIGHEVNGHSNELLVPIGNYFEGSNTTVH